MKCGPPTPRVISAATRTRQPPSLQTRRCHCPLQRFRRERRGSQKPPHLRPRGGRAPIIFPSPGGPCQPGLLLFSPEGFPRRPPPQGTPPLPVSTMISL